MNNTPLRRLSALTKRLRRFKGVHDAIEELTRLDEFPLRTYMIYGVKKLLMPYAKEEGVSKANARLVIRKIRALEQREKEKKAEQRRKKKMRSVEETSSDEMKKQKTLTPVKRGEGRLEGWMTPMRPVNTFAIRRLTEIFP